MASKPKARTSRTKSQGATALARLDHKTHAVELFLAGMAVAEIARKLDCNIATVYRYLEETRCELLQTKKEYFDTKVAALLEQNLEALQEMAGLFCDRRFLEKANAFQIDAISRAAGIISDKTFILLAAAGRHQQREDLSASVASASGRADSDS